ncbi:polysaccharide biosynthesis C-terminal domain-containing protein [Dyadobacter sp. CY261]|uniref:lipid II flippase MurJ n=1 Tax=Dyadobacter sp. CY261 TaxID=2907203 RepID=UPI001F4243C1|nr:lipid II flippase MurJ [Dyadobacter sp. CY261]MCF0075127.1 polysaccharide biosynthesis C-terminal domain-containing protein [Dyadobacter sp. CY261]
MYIPLSTAWSSITKNPLLLKTARLSVITVFANMLAFLVPIYIANIFGISKETDNFFFSYGLITFGSIIFSNAVSSTLVPFLKEKMGDKAAFDTFLSSVFFFSSKFLLIAAAVFLAITVSLYLVLDNNIYLYTAISIPIFILTIFNSLCYGILYSLNKFDMAATSPISRTIIIFISIFLFNKYLSIYSVILGYNLGELAKLVHLVYIIKIKNKIALTFQNRDLSIIKVFVREGSYQALSTSISSAAPIIGKVIATFLTVGAVSILDYGDKPFMIFNVLLNSFLVILLSQWSSDALNNNFKLGTLHKVLIGIMLLSGVLLILTYYFQANLIDIIYPTLSATDRKTIGDIFVISMVGFIFNSANQVINRAAIAFKETNIMVQAAVIKSILTVIFDLLFVLKYGVIGIAIATTIVHLIGLILNYFLFVRKVKYKITLP